MTKVFELKGRHVLAALLGLFGLVLGVNVAYVTIALSSFPGEDQPKSYLQGLRYNEALAARAAERALGWRAVVEARRAADGEAKIILTVFAGASALEGLTLEGLLRRPVSAEDDRTLSLAPEGNSYVARARVPKGAWDLHVTARDAAGHSFTVEKRLWLP